MTIECDELWSFVKTKENKQWIWLAIDKLSREIVGVARGNRSSRMAKENKQWIWLAFDKLSREIVGVARGNRSSRMALELWNSLPGVYRQCAVSYTEGWAA